MTSRSDHDNAIRKPQPGIAAELPQPARRISSEQLFGQHQEIEIEHHGACYRLRKTSLGKLILTK